MIGLVIIYIILKTKCQREISHFGVKQTPTVSLEVALAIDSE